MLFRLRGTRQLLPAEDEGLERLSPRALGGELFDHLIRDRVRTLFDQSLGGSFGAADRGLRILIKVDPLDPRLEQLTALPWELLYRSETDDYLALSRRTPIVRYLDVPRPLRPILLPETLKVLVAMASPHDQPPLKLKVEKKKLEDATAGQARLELSFVENAAAEEVRERLVAEGSHVLHFMGHGDFDPESREGLLYFEREDGGSDPLSGRALATSLKDLPNLGLIVLNACNTARSTGKKAGSPFSGVASALVLGGMPAVLAMQQPITDRAAIRFSQAFYRHLAQGDPLDIALTEGRQAIHGANARSLEWATPVLFVRVPDGMVFAAKSGAPPVPVAASPVTAPTLLQRQEIEPARSRTKVAVAVGTVALVGLGVWAGVKVLSHSKGGGGGGLIEPIPDTPDPKPPEPEPEPDVPAPKPKKPANVSPKTPDEVVTRETLPISAPPAVVEEPISNDPSDLACEWISLARRATGGLRAEVSCRNDTALKVVVRISASLSDDNSSAYGIVGSDLPPKGGEFLLEVPAAGSRSFTLDFPAPKLGASQFYLKLTPSAGSSLQLESPSLELVG